MNNKWVKARSHYAKFYDYCLKLIMNFEDIKDKIIDHIYDNDKRILDVHCKTGIMTIKIAKERPHAQVIGIENNHQFLRLAKRKKRQNLVKNIEFMNFANLELYEEKFDVITLFFALNDLPVEAIKKLLMKIKSILRVNKKLIIVDYTNKKNVFSQFFVKVYHKVFLNNNFKSFLVYDICDYLQNIGFQSITYEEYNGIKMISSINNGV